EVNYVVYDDAWGMFPDTFGKPPAPTPGVSFHLVDHDGEVYTQGEAIARVTSYAHRGGLRLWCYQHVQPYARLSDWWYETTASRPVLADRLHTVFSGRDDEACTYFFTRWMFVR